MFKSVCLLSLLSTCLLTNGQNAFQGPACVNSPFKSDGFLLVLNWPIAFCAKNRRGCVLDRPVHRWLIHGLWPQFNITKQNRVRELSGSPYPQYCCHQQEYVNNNYYKLILSNKFLLFKSFYSG